MADHEASICNERVWVITLLASNCMSAALGIIIFGLSLGIIKSDVFVFEVWQFLAPVFQIACADIACGVFMCAVAALGFGYLSYRNLLFGKVYYVLLILLFTYQLSIGIATVIISDEKTQYVRAVAIIMCMDPTLKSINNAGPSGIEVGAEQFGVDSSGKRLSAMFARENSPLDKLYAQHDLEPGSIEECSYFVDVSTPCGALLICGSILYLYMLYCTSCIRDLDKRFHNHQADNVKRSWQGSLISSAGKRPFDAGKKVQFQEHYLGASPNMYNPEPVNVDSTPQEIA